MYQKHSTRQCVVCFDDVNAKASLYHIIYQPPLCLSCMQKFSFIDRKYVLLGYPICILYNYNDFFKQLLFQYKGQGDEALKDVFLWTVKEELKKTYQAYTIVAIPSSTTDNATRGFCPNEKIIATFSQSIFTGLYKQGEYKQTSQKDRRGIKNVMKIKDGFLLTNKKILLFDDVVTSSNTLQAAVNLIAPYHPQSIEILVLASKQIDTLFT